MKHAQRLVAHLVFVLAVCSAVSGCERKGGPITVDRVEPATGATGGGDQVTIVGSGFEPGKTQADIRFGVQKADNVIIASDSRINVVTPAGSRGPVDVTVEFHDGKAFKIPGGFKFIQPADGNAVRKAWEHQQAAAAKPAAP